MKVRILETEKTKQDTTISGLIGTVWTVDEAHPHYVIIDCCGGVRLNKGEYEIVKNTDEELLDFTNVVTDFVNDVWRFADAGELTEDILLEFSQTLAHTVKEKTIKDLITYIDSMENKTRYRRNR
ncbi:hypothetical protein MAWWA_90 [Bacillus phage vB_BspH_Mawwa]|nr:hypothetical protein MAWWA_90 [Bacillus phage vB_BspH_Mawwa]